MTQDLSSSGFVGAEFATWKFCFQSGKTGYKNAIWFLRACFSMRFRGGKRQNTRTKCLKKNARKVKSGLEFYRLRKELCQKCHEYSFQGQIETGTPCCSTGPPGSVLGISAHLIPYEPVSPRKKPDLPHLNPWRARPTHTQLLIVNWKMFKLIALSNYKYWKQTPDELGLSITQ